jgi:hypothetical protein
MNQIPGIPTRISIDQTEQPALQQLPDPISLFPPSSFPALHAIADAFTLNVKQREAFFVIGEHLSKGYRARKNAQTTFPNLPNTPINDSGLYM